MAGSPRFFGPLLIAAEFERTLHFYRDELGLAFEGAAPYARTTGGPSQFGIIDSHFWAAVNGSEMAVFPGASVPPSTLISLEVDDLEARFDRLLVLGARFRTTPTSRPRIGRRNVFLRDPDGRTVELAQRI